MTENKKHSFINIRPSVFLSLIVLTASFILLYKNDFSNILIRWGKGDFSYCYLVPVIFLYLLYLKADLLRSLEQRSSHYGLLLLFASGVMLFSGRQGSIEALSFVSIWLSVISIFLIIFGLRIVKELAFPLVILGFIVPVPSFLNNMFTFKLKLISSYLSVKVMQLSGLSVYREGNIIDLGSTQLQVVDACSGLRYVYPLLLMGFLFAYMFNKKWWERIILIASTIPIAIISNSLRIAITGYLTAMFSPAVAEGFFHGFSGFLIFIVSFAILAIFCFFLRMVRKWFCGDTPASAVYPAGDRAVINLKNTKISFLLLAALLLTGFWGLSSIYATNQITPHRKSFETFPTTIGDWEGRKSYLSEDILNSLWADDYIQIHFKNKKTDNYLLLFVPYYKYQKNRHTAHAPAACLIGSGYAPLSKKTISKAFLPPFGDVEIGQMVLEKQDQLLLSNFWFHGRGRVIANEYFNKWYLFQDSITKKRTDGALVRIEMPLRRGQSIEEAQKVIDEFTLKVLELLPEYVPE